MRHFFIREGLLDETGSACVAERLVGCQLARSEAIRRGGGGGHGFGWDDEGLAEERGVTLGGFSPALSRSPQRQGEQGHKV